MIISEEQWRGLERNHTSPSRSELTSTFRNSLMFPFTIQSDTIANRFLVIITPNRGSTFGWWRVLHAITSLQNLYETWLVVDAHNKSKARPATHSFNLLEVCLIYSQNLDRNVLVPISTLPDIRKSATI